MADQAKKGSKAWIWVLVCIAVVLLLAVVGLYAGPASTLREAETALSQGNYDQAAALYTSVDESTFLGIRLADLPLGNYRGAAEKAAQALAAKETSLLTLADTQLADHEFEAARATYAALNDTDTAAERTAAAWYQEAEEKLAIGDYTGAHDAFVSAGSYQDAQARAIAVYTLHGEALLAEKRWADAADAFALAGDSAARDYCRAQIALAANDLLTAETLLQSAGDYADAQELLAAFAEDIDAAHELAEKRAPFLTLGGQVTLGTYEQDDDLANGAEPLTWLVAAVEGDNVLLVSEYVIDVMPFNRPAMAVTWEDSSLAWWLTQRFLPLAFTAEEQSWLVSRDVLKGVTNRVDAATFTDMATDTDLAAAAEVTAPLMVTVLDSIDAMSYFGSAEALQAEGTPYAVAQQVAVDEDGHARWWMRTDGFYGDSAATMQDSVTFLRVDDRFTGIRPAIWVNLVTMFE